MPQAGRMFPAGFNPLFYPKRIPANSGQIVGGQHLVVPPFVCIW
jgi:hypothetical protein